MNSKKIEKEFKEVEKKLIKLLKSASLNFSDVDDEITTKENIKNHIKKVVQAKLLFEEYEKLAQKLYDIDDEDDDLVLKKSQSEVFVQIDDKNTKSEELLLTKQKRKQKRTNSNVEKGKTL